MSAINAHPTPTAEWYTFDGTASCVVQWGERRATLYRSPTGRSFRIWVDGVEWKPDQNGRSDLRSNPDVRSAVAEMRGPKTTS